MKEYFKYLGHNAHYRVNKSLVIEVELVDVKKCYGDIHFLIKPVSGMGEAWVSIGSLGLPEEFSLKGFNQPMEDK